MRRGDVRRKDDNMLKITTDGRKAALDLRLVEPNSGFTTQSKVARCVENVSDIYFKTKKAKSTQLIFCDSSTPKDTFNMYYEVKRLLISEGVSASDIAYIHDAATELQRERLFAMVRNGDVRVLIGSTFKLGLGVNVQDKLIAVHHLDIPWRPADMIQREGRIIRQGNENKQVFIYRYITEGSFDAYSWQLLETKQRFITGLLAGSITERSGSDIESTVLNYAEVKALAVGNPLVKKRVERANELTRCLSLQRKTVEMHIRLEQELSELPSRIKHQKELISKCRKDYEFYSANRTEYDKEQRRELRSQLFTAISNNVLMPKETHLFTYQGFEVVLPANMLAEKPYVYLVREGRYYIEVGNTESGGIIRIDNFLDNFKDRLKMLREGLTSLNKRQSEIEGELSKDEGYADRIERLREELAKLDKKLGVTGNG